MTLEPDPAAVLVHERLEQAVSSMRAPDVEAGWAALAAQLEGPIAPVVPLRKATRGRFIAFAVAAALMVAGSAFAAVSHVGDAPAHVLGPVVPPVHTSVTGPHAHAPFSGPPVERRSQHHREHGGTTQGGTSNAGEGGGSQSPSGSGDGISKPGDDPNDRDQGTGNDGQHNDHGGGNNGPEGSHPSTSGGSSHGGPGN